MSTRQPTRPGARRPGAPTTAAPQRGAQRGQSAEELHALPEFVDEGNVIDLDPANTSTGGFGGGEGTSATIVKARFERFIYKDKEGNVLDQYPPSLDLFITFRADGDAPDYERRPERMAFANIGLFGPTKDGLFVKPRPHIMKERTSPPQPWRYNPGVLFLQSLKDAGLSIDKLNKQGLAAIEGLKVLARKRKVEGREKAVLLVDYIEGVEPSSGSDSKAAPASQAAGKAPKGGGGSSAPRAQAAAAAADAPQANSEVETLAEQALVDILSQAENNTISRSQIPTTLIKMDAWKGHAQRGGILKALREDSFITRSSAPWTVDGNNVTLG